MRVAPVVVTCARAPASTVDGGVQLIAAQHTARQVVQMNQCAAIGQPKGAHDLQRRLVRQRIDHGQRLPIALGCAKAQVQLAMHRLGCALAAVVLCRDRIRRKQHGDGLHS